MTLVKMVGKDGTIEQHQGVLDGDVIEWHVDGKWVQCGGNCPHIRPAFRGWECRKYGRLWSYINTAPMRSLNCIEETVDASQ